MNAISKLVASAAFLVAALAGTQSASAQEFCSFDQGGDEQQLRCGFLGRLRAKLIVGLQDAVVETTTPNTLVLGRRIEIPHEIHLEITCNTGTANNGDHYSVYSSSSTAECPNGGYVNQVDAWIVVDPDSTGQRGQGLGEGEEGEGDDEGGDDEGSDDEGNDGEGNDDEGGE